MYPKSLHYRNTWGRTFAIGHLPWEFCHRNSLFQFQEAILFPSFCDIRSIQVQNPFKRSFAFPSRSTESLNSNISSTGSKRSFATGSDAGSNGSSGGSSSRRALQTELEVKLEERKRSLENPSSEATVWDHS